MTSVYVVAGLALLGMIGLFAIVLLPNNRITVAGHRTMTDSGLLRGIIGGI